MSAATLPTVSRVRARTRSSQRSSSSLHGRAVRRRRTYGGFSPCRFLSEVQLPVYPLSYPESLAGPSGALVA